MGTSGTYQPVRKTEETISDVSQQDVCIIEGYMLKIGTHDSATGEKAMSWWMKLLTPFWKTQSKTIKEQYEAYMRPEWKEDKRQQRLAKKRRKREMAQEEHRVDPSAQGWGTAVSFEQLCEREYGFREETGQTGLDEILEKEELLAALRRELAKLEKLDRIILQMAMSGISEAAIGREVGLSQKGVNKRKHRLLEQLRKQLKDYR